MLVESFSHPKCRALSKPSDDTVLITPNVIGVFDGATDPLGRTVGNYSQGRFASETVANECASLLSDERGFELSLIEIVERLSLVLRERKNQLGFTGQAATTLALFLYNSEKFRFIVLGDSGIRINNTNVLRHCKLVDEIAASA